MKQKIESGKAIKWGGGGQGGWEPGRIGGGRGTGGEREKGGRAGRGRSKRAGSGREMRNTNYFNSTMRYKTFKIKKPKYI